MDVPRLSQRESGCAHWLPSLIGMKAEIVFLLLPALLLPFSSISEEESKVNHPFHLSLDAISHLSFWTSVQFSSVAQSCPTLCDPMNQSTPGLPVHYQLLEFTHTHVQCIGDAIQLSHPLLALSPALNLSQHQGLFKWVRSSHQVAKVLEFQPQHQSFQWTPRTDLL